MVFKTRRHLLGDGGWKVGEYTSHFASAKDPQLTPRGLHLHPHTSTIHTHTTVPNTHTHNHLPVSHHLYLQEIPSPSITSSPSTTPPPSTTPTSPTTDGRPSQIICPSYQISSQDAYQIHFSNNWSLLYVSQHCIASILISFKVRLRRSR